MAREGEDHTQPPQKRGGPRSCEAGARNYHPTVVLLGNGNAMQRAA